MEALGINIVNILIYIALFMLLYMVVDSKLIKPMVAVIEKRKNEIKENQDKSEKLDLGLSEIDKKGKEKLKEATEELKVREKEAIVEVTAQAKDIIKSAETEAASIIKRADEYLAKQKVELDKTFEERVQKAAQNLIAEEYSINKSEFDKALVEKAIKQLEN